MAKTKKQSLIAWIAVCAAVVGLVLYIVSGVIYPSKSILSWEVPVLTVIALLALSVVAYAGKSLPGFLRDVFIVGGGLALIGAICFFVLKRLDPAADIWFIPVNYPAAEKTSLYISCVGIAFYLIAFVMTLVKAFTAKD